MRYFLSILIGLIYSLAGTAQNFSYTLSTDSAAWNELSSQTILNTSNSAWQFSYKIPIGFSFNYLGRNFDSLTIETNGYLVFDEDRYYAFTMFNDFRDRVDSSGNHAVLGYELSGTSGNHILKIQYKNTGQETNGARALTWQVWLKENGRTVELHVGPNDFHFTQESVTVTDSLTMEDSTYTVNVVDTNNYCRIGLINQNMDLDVNGYFIAGTISSISGQLCDENNPDTPFIMGIPNEGIRIVFTPNFN